jgi:hypothetical protein
MEIDIDTSMDGDSTIDRDVVFFLYECIPSHP